MPLALETVVKQLADSGIVSPGKLENFVPPKASPKDAEELLRELHKQNLLTKFQAQQVAAGKAKALILGNYTILDKIGAGGMGQVFKAEHRRMKRLVAIKMLPPSMTKDAAALARFQREVEAAAKLEHPNIVHANDADQVGNTHFLVMQYVEGSDLSALVKKNGPLPVEKAVNYILQAACGLEYAHKRGVIHRDIKPANLLLDSEGTVKILDMGLARIEAGGDAATQAELTGTGAVMGTVDYMAPEQARSTHHADARADIYSLGCSLHYLLTSRPLYGGDTITAKLISHQFDPIPSLGDVPEQLDAVYQSMVAKTVEERYQTMTEVITDLSSILPSPLAGEGSGVRGLAPPIDSNSNSPLTNSNLSFLKDATAAHTIQRTTHKHTQPAKPAAMSARRLPKRGVLIGAGVLSAVVLLAAIIVSLRTKDGTQVVDQADATEQVAALVSFALDFDGKTSFVATPILLEQELPFTVEAVVIPLSGTIMSDANNLGFSLEVGRLGWHFTLNQGGSSATPSINARSRLALRAKSVHTAGVYDGNEIRLYVDGVLQEKRAGKFKPQNQCVVIGGNPNVKVSGPEAEPPTVLFNGIIDEVRISKTARYTGNFKPEPRFTPDSETIALYHFDEGSGDTAFDSSENKHHAKIVGAKWVRAGTLSQPMPSAVASQTPLTSTSPKIPAEALAFGGHRYLLVVDPVTWDAAKGKAKALGGHLATVTSKEENDWIKSTVLSSLPDENVAWIGGEKIPGQQSWTWITGEPWGFTDRGKTIDNDQHEGMGFIQSSQSRLVWGSWPTKTLPVAKTGSLAGKSRAYGYLVEWDTAASPTPPLAKAPFDAKQARAHQEAWAKHLGIEVETPNSVGMKMVLIPPGEFMMGSTDAQVEEALKIAEETKADQTTKDRIQKAERPQHKAVITKPFQMSATEVTVGQFKKFSLTGYVTEAEKAVQDVKAKTYHSDGSDALPAAYITWNDAVAYCQWLSSQEKRIYRLPTEAEWEYACRAGTTTTYSFGDDYAELPKYAWYSINAAGKSHPVGTLLPNPFGLFDMHGNLWEWCGDCWDAKWYEKSSQNDPIGLSTGTERVVRGGHWTHIAVSCRSAYRHGSPTASYRHHHTGFRCVTEFSLPTTAPSTSSSKLFMHDPTFPQWMAQVQAMPAQEQINEVSKKLMELNPGFDGKVKAADNVSIPTKVNGAVNSIGIITDHVTDISPIRAFVGLKNLSCSASQSAINRRGPLSDLSPLQGMNLTWLAVSFTTVLDFDQLRGMPLTGLQFDGTSVSDLSSLRGMPLTSLRFSGTPVVDLSPLGDMPLTGLVCHHTPVSDVTSLATCKNLASLNLTNTKVTPDQVAALQNALPNCKIEWDDPAKATPAPTAPIK